MKWLRQFELAPLTLRVPLAVAALMIFISGLISERVLDRLSTTQQSYMQSLAESYLGGFATAVTPSVIRADTWEIFDTIERMKPTGETLSVVETVVVGTNGNILAANLPQLRQTYEPVPQDFAKLFPDGSISINSESSLGYIKRNIVYQEKRIGEIYAVFDVSSLMTERKQVLTTLLITNGLIASVLALAGFLAVRRMILPMRSLEMHMIDAASGTSTEIPDSEFPKTGTESTRLLRAYNQLVRAGEERQSLSAKLAEEEKLSSLGRLASGMAHEINNPLGGMMNVVDTLKKHGDKQHVRNSSLELLQRGLEGIREVVQAALANYRPERLSRPFAAQDIQDLSLLIGPELARRGQRLHQKIEVDGIEAFNLPAGPIRQAVLNLLLNAIAATAPSGDIGFVIRQNGGSIVLAICDQGGGMPEEAKYILTGKSSASRPNDGGGIGLWVVARICDELGALLEVTETDLGSTVEMIFNTGSGEEKIAA